MDECILNRNEGWRNDWMKIIDWINKWASERVDKGCLDL